MEDLTFSFKPRSRKGRDEENGEASDGITISIQCHESFQGYLIQDGGLTDKTGLMLWPGTHALCQYIASNGELFQQSIGDRPAVVELGCGTGLPGLLVAALGARAILTDRDVEIVSQAKRHVILNHLEPHCKALLLEWGDQERVDAISQLLGPKRANFVLGADIVYPAISRVILDRLFATVHQLLATEGCFICSYVERDRKGVTRNLFLAAHHAGFSVSVILWQEYATVRPLMDATILLFRPRRIPEEVEDYWTVVKEHFPYAFGTEAEESSSEEEWEPPMGAEDQD